MKDPFYILSYLPFLTFFDFKALFRIHATAYFTTINPFYKLARVDFPDLHGGFQFSFLHWFCWETPTSLPTKWIKIVAGSLKNEFMLAL